MHAIPLDETAAGPLDLYANGRAITAIDMSAQFVIVACRAIITTTKEFRLTVRVRGRAARQVILRHRLDRLDLDRGNCTVAIRLGVSVGMLAPVVMRAMARLPRRQP